MDTRSPGPGRGEGAVELQAWRHLHCQMGQGRVETTRLNRSLPVKYLMCLIFHGPISLLPGMTQRLVRDRVDAM